MTRHYPISAVLACLLMAPVVVGCSPGIDAADPEPQSPLIATPTQSMPPDALTSDPETAPQAEGRTPSDVSPDAEAGRSFRRAIGATFRMPLSFTIDGALGGLTLSSTGAFSVFPLAEESQRTVTTGFGFYTTEIRSSGEDTWFRLADAPAIVPDVPSCWTRFDDAVLHRLDGQSIPSRDPAAGLLVFRAKGLGASTSPDEVIVSIKLITVVGQFGSLAQGLGLDLNASDRVLATATLTDGLMTGLVVSPADVNAALRDGGYSPLPATHADTDRGLRVNYYPTRPLDVRPPPARDVISLGLPEAEYEAASEKCGDRLRTIER